MANRSITKMLKTVGQYAYRIAVTVIISLTIINLIEPAQPKTVTQEIHELANNFEPDWNDYGQIKYYIVWDHSIGQPAIVGTIKNQAYGVSYFETASQAGEAMLYLGDKLRVLK